MSYLRLKCIKFDFGCGSAPDPAGGAYVSTPPDPVSGFKGPTSKERKGRGKGWNRGKGGVRVQGKGKLRSPNVFLWPRPSLSTASIV